MGVGDAFDDDEGGRLASLEVGQSSEGSGSQVALSEHCAINIVTLPPPSSHLSSSWELTNVELYSKLTLGFVVGSPQSTVVFGSDCYEIQYLRSYTIAPMDRVIT